MRTTLLLGLVALALVIGAWLGSESSVRGLPAPRAPVVRSGPEGAEEPAPEVIADSARGVERRTSATTQEGATVTVLVVDMERKPVPGIGVLARRVESASLSVTERWTGTAIDRAVEGAWMWTTNEAGLVEVPAPDGELTIVVARDDHRWGREVLEDGAEAADEPPRLVVSRDRNLTVRVVDPQGKPMGSVPVQVQREAWSWGTWKEAVTELPSGETRFTHLQLGLAYPDDEPLRVTPGVLAPDARIHALDPDDWPTETIVFELERGATVVVEALDPEGVPCKRRGSVELLLAEEGATTAGPRSWDPDQRRVQEVRVDARARFEHVPPGQTLEVLSHTAGFGPPTRLVAAGPVRAGEELLLRVRTGADHPVLRVRVRDASGQPLRDAQLGVRVEGAHAPRPWHGEEDPETPTDEEGVADLGIDRGWEAKRLELHLGAESATIELPPTLPDGLTDLGELVLGPRPVVVTGRVVGPAGEPMAGVRLHVSELPGRRRGPRSAEDFEREIHYRSPLERMHIETREDGTFEVYGTVRAARCQLNTLVHGYTTPTLEFDVGTRDFVVRLVPAGAIVGSFVLGEDVPRDALWLSLRSAEGTPTPSHYSGLREDGSFRLAPLPDGEYHVTLRLRDRAHGRAYRADSPEDLLVGVEGIVVAGGQEVRHPALDGVDLRAVLHTFRLGLEFADGGDPPDGLVRFGPTDTGELDSFTDVEGDEVVLVSRAARIDVDLQVPGYRRVELRGITGDEHVVLERGIPVRVTLVGDGSLLEAPYGLSVCLAVGEDTPHVDWSSPAFDSGREIEVSAPGPGDVRVYWLVHRSSHTGSSVIRLDADPEQRVHLTGEPGQRVQVVLSAEEAERLREAVERF